MPSAVLIPVIIVVVLIALAIFLHFVPMGLWISSLASGVHIPISALVGMRIRRIQRPEPDHQPAGNPLPGRR